MEGFHRTGEAVVDDLQRSGRATAFRYGDTLEVFLRPNDSPGCFKITGGAEYVRESVRLILERFGDLNP